MDKWIDDDNSNNKQGLAFFPEGGFLDGRVAESTVNNGVTRWNVNDTRIAGAGGGYSEVKDNYIDFNSAVTLDSLFRDGQPWPIGTYVRQPFTRGDTFFASANIAMTPGEWKSRYRNFAGFTASDPQSQFMTPWTSREARLVIVWNGNNQAGVTQKIKDIAVQRV